MSESLYLQISTVTAIVIIVIAAQLCGRLARLIGQPAVVGEMISGILLGPTALGYALPEFSSWTFNDETKPILHVLSMIGLSIYMFLIGLNHENNTDNRERFLPYCLGTLGVVFPIVIGALATSVVAMHLKPEGISDFTFVMFCGGALSVTAFPMLARVLQERNMVKTVFGSTAVKSAAIDDALAWCVLAVIGALVSTGSATSAIMTTIIPALAFVAVLFVFSSTLFARPMIQAVKQQKISDGLFARLLVLVLIASIISDFIGLYSVFGGFIAGLALPHISGFSQLMHEQLIKVIRCLFLPIFFAYSGLNTDLTTVFSISGLLVFCILLLAALLSKAASVVTTLKLYGWRNGEILAMAGLMNARGLMILIYMSIGLTMGIVETELYSIIVLIAITTTAVAIPIYRLHFSEIREAEARQAWAIATTDKKARNSYLLPPINHNHEDLKNENI